MIVTASSMVSLLSSLLQSTTLLYTSRGPWVVCIRGEAIGSAPFTPGGPGAAAGTCTCYSPLLYYSIHQSIFFFYSIVDDGQKVMLIRFVTAVWIAPVLYDIIGRQNVYPSSNQPFFFLFPACTVVPSCTSTRLSNWAFVLAPLFTPTDFGCLLCPILYVLQFVAYCVL